MPSVDNTTPGLERAWYAVALSERVGTAPVTVAVLGEHWVVLRLGGELVAFEDRCPHRLAPLALGKAYRAAPVSDPICGFRAYRLIVLKKALRALGDRPLVASDGWAANVELLALAAGQARRIEEVPLDLRYDIRERESRFRATRTLRELLRVRNGSMWTPVETPSS